METTITGYIGTTIRIHSFIPSEQDRAANNGRTSRVREIVVDGVLEVFETLALVTLGMGTFKTLLNPKNLKPNP